MGAKATVATTTDVERRRTVIRLAPNSYARSEYWAQSRGFSSVNEYMAEAVEEKIERENGDYDLPTMEIARVTELSDLTKALSVDVANLSRLVVTMADTLVGLARGDNYLSDLAEDGELSK